MLTDSPLPLNDLQNLLDWLRLPATQEVLTHLRERSQQASKMALSSPEVYKAHLDGVKCDQLRHQFIGNHQGVSYLENFLNLRKAELEALVEQQDNKNKVT